MLLYIPFASTLDPVIKFKMAENRTIFKTLNCDLFFLSNNELKHLLKSKSKNARTLTRMLAGS